MRGRTFHKIVNEFDLDTAIKVVEFGVILRTTKTKTEDLTDKGSFLNRCKRMFNKKIASSSDDVDKIISIFFASCDFETREDMEGLGGCSVPTKIGDLISL